MTPNLLLDNLIAYSIQITVLVAGTAALVTLLRIRNPQVLYRGWQLLLALCLAAPLLQPWRATEAVGGAAGSAGSSSIFLSAGAGFNIAAILVGVVAVGVMARAALFFLGLLRLRRLRTASRKLRRIPEPLACLWEDLAPEAEVCLSSDLNGAASIGVRRPAVLLPDTFTEMNLPMQKAVLCHELLHVRRRDWVFALAEEAVRSLLWFHPAVWWALERIQLAREQLVDREVVRHLGERDVYLDALLHIASLRVRVPLATAPTFLRPRHLRQRVALILKEDVMSKKRLAVSAAVVACVAVLAAGWAGWSFPLQAPPERSGPFGDVYRVGDGVSAPKLIHKIEPDYTEEARDAKLQGTVVLSVEVGADGFIQDVQVRRGLGLGLDEQAIAAISQWEFTPGMRNGEPVAVAATVEVNFKLM